MIQRRQHSAFLPVFDAERGQSRASRVMLSTVVLVLWLLAGPESNPDLYLTGGALFGGLTMLAILTASLLDGIVVRIVVFAVAVLGVIAAIAPHAFSELLAQRIVIGEILVVGIVGPILVARGLIKRGRLDVHTVANAVALYLLVGLASAMAISIASELESEPVLQFMGSTPVATGSTPGQSMLRDNVYWSYVTLSTTGYGDFVPRTGSARAIALVTFLFGQLYLVIAVASIVTSLTSRIAFEREEAVGSGPDARR